ncbi:tetratricopeptide repeat protein [Sphingomonas daechungensis]|uniref:tetratricopeptide repeat protein n=1 Tax=Sphingomonas daechungensis TaxID=1176646 RepID=UPI003782E01C
MKAIRRWLGHAAVTIRLWLASRLAAPLLGLINSPPKAVARHLSQAGWSKYRESESYFLEDGIALVEASWALAKDPDTACRLGAMYERANRNGDATVLFGDALRHFPSDSSLRYQCAAHMLRHGESNDIRDFLQFVARFDPEDPFVAYTTRMMRAQSDFVAEAESKVAATPAGKPRVLMCFPVWGDDYINDFMGFACSSLLAEGNLPQAGQRWAVHILIFTSSSGEAAIRANPRFGQLGRYAALHFLQYPSDALDYRATMEGHYGERLGTLYARACKFQLHSAPHYATLEVGRRLGAFVMPLAGDVVFGDGTLVNALSLMDGPADVVNVAGFRLSRDQVLGEAEARFRRADGVLEIPPSAHGELVAKFMPAELFADSDGFSDFPLFVCWRVPGGGVVAHVTHFHPICLRAAAFQNAFKFTIDPMDGRFLSRQRIDPSRIHLVTDMGVSISDWNDDPTYGTRPTGRMVPEKVSLFLWMYWDDLREFYFRTPVRIGAPAASMESWAAVEAGAKRTVETILAEAKRRESANGLR